MVEASTHGDAAAKRNEGSAATTHTDRASFTAAPFRGYMLGFAKMMSMPRGQAGQDVFHAIADGNRRVLIDLMERGPRAVGELVVASGLSYSATSQHLAILRRAGLVSSEASGRRRIYRLRPAALREVYDWSGRYREFWRGRLDALGDLLGRHADFLG